MGDPVHGKMRFLGLPAPRACVACVRTRAALVTIPDARVQEAPLIHKQTQRMDSQPRAKIAACSLQRGACPRETKGNAIGWPPEERVGDRRSTVKSERAAAAESAGGIGRTLPHVLFNVAASVRGTGVANSEPNGSLLLIP